MGIGGGVKQFKQYFIDYLKGDGLDIGFGGYAVIPTAITIDLPHPYQKTDSHVQNLHGDATNLYWFKDSVLDYIFSSHCLEDFIDTRAVLAEWLRVIKPNGIIALLLPDQVRFEKEALLVFGRKVNLAHKHPDFSIIKVRNILKELKITIIKEYEFYNMDGFVKDREYNFGVIGRK